MVSKITKISAATLLALGLSGTAIMTGNKKFTVPNRCHHFDHILSHGTLRIRVMICRARWFLTIPITSQVGAYYVKVINKERGNLMPNDMGLRIAMQ
jgi:hypothetical protein